MIWYIQQLMVHNRNHSVNAIMQLQIALNNERTGIHWVLASLVIAAKQFVPHSSRLLAGLDFAPHSVTGTLAKLPKIKIKIKRIKIVHLVQRDLEISFLMF